MQKIRCIFMASDPIAIPSLELLKSDLKDRMDLVAIYTQPDRRTGRGKKLTANAIKLWAETNGIATHQPPRIDDAAISVFKELEADLILVMAYGHILPKRILSLPSFGFYNLHASLLPKLRGASPIETAIVTGHSRTGVTLMEVVPALDAGPIIGAEACEIEANDTAISLRSTLSELCVPLLRNTLPAILDRNIKATAQNSDQATYCRLIDKSDGYVDFSLTTAEILNHIRGFQPWPGALVDLDGVTYRIGKASPAQFHESAHSLPTTGGLMQCNKHQLLISTADGWLEVLEIQRPGGKMLPVMQFLNGNAFEPNTQLDYPNRYPLVKEKYFKKSKL